MQQLELRRQTALEQHRELQAKRTEDPSSGRPGRRARHGRGKQMRRY